MKSSILLHPARHADHGIHRFLSWIHHWLDLTRDIAIILFHLEPLIVAHRRIARLEQDLYRERILLDQMVQKRTIPLEKQVAVLTNCNQHLSAQLDTLRQHD